MNIQNNQDISPQPSKPKRFVVKIIFFILFIGLIIIGIKAGINYYGIWQDQQAKMHFDKAETLFQNQNYQQAVVEYQLVVTKYSKSKYMADCWFKIGFIYYKFLLKYDLAREPLEIIYKKYPESPYLFYALFYLLDIYNRLGRYNDMITVAEEISSRYPDKIDLDSMRLALAEGYAKMFKIDEAYQQILKIRNKDTNFVKNSQVYYQILASKEPDNPQPHYELARIYTGMGLKEKAKLEKETAEGIKKNNLRQMQLAQKRAEQKPYKQTIGMPGKTKVKISAREEELYISFNKALPQSWNEIAKYKEKLGKPRNDKEQRLIEEKCKEYFEKFWEKWYKEHKTTREECDKIFRKIKSDQELVELLNNKIIKN